MLPSDHPCVRYNDRGLTLGHGLFETILVKKSIMPALDYHWQRLESSALLMGIILPFDRYELETMINQLIAENAFQNKIAGARVTVTHGEAERGILPVNIPEPNFLISVFECAAPGDRPFTALIVNTRKNEHSLSSRIKSLSFLDNIFARQEAMSQKYDEAILLNTAGNVADGSIANVFIINDGQIFTPPVSDGALPGVMRSILIEEFKDNFPIVEKSISADELLMADEVFLTNALMGLKSVQKINTREFWNFEVQNKIRMTLTYYLNTD